MSWPLCYCRFHYLFIRGYSRIRTRITSARVAAVLASLMPPLPAAGDEIGWKGTRLEDLPGTAIRPVCGRPDKGFADWCRFLENP